MRCFDKVFYVCGGLKTEELSDCDADTGKGEGSTEPCEVGAFVGEMVAGHGALIIETEGSEGFEELVWMGFGHGGEDGGFSWRVIVIDVLISVA